MTGHNEAAPEAQRPSNEDAAWVHSQINEAVRPLQNMIAELREVILRSQSVRSTEAITPQPSSSGAATPRVEVAEDSTLNRTEAAEGPVTRKKPLPLPEKFSGKRADFARWKQDMREKLELDAHLLGSRRESWYLVNRCLGESAQKMVATFYIEAGPTHQYNPEVFLQYLERVYGNANQQQDAANKLRSLRQKDSTPFASFLPKFERILAEAGGMDWADRAKISFLEGALSSKLRRSLIAVQLPDNDYPEWQHQVFRIASNLERFESQERQVPGPTNWKLKSRGNTGSPHQPQDAEGDTVMGGINKVTTKEGLKTTKKRTNNATKSSRGCYVCGEEGHIARNCEKRADCTRLRQVAQIEAESSEGPTSEEDASLSSESSEEGKG